MNKKIYQIITILLVIFVTACNSKNKPIDQLRSLNENLSENMANFSEDDWEDVAGEFEEILEDIAEHRSEYSEAELREIGRLEGQCVAKISKAYMEALSDEIEGANNVLGGFMEGFKESDLDKEYENLEEALDETMKIFNN